MKKYRTWAEINLKHIGDNIRNLKAKVGNDTKILAVVKADGYGHGAVPVSRAALANGAFMIGVGDSTEAIELRRSGITEPILVLGAVIQEEISWMITYNITPTIHSMDLLELFNNHAKLDNTIFNVHIKIDTGMTRLGSTPQRAMEIVKRMPSFPYLRLEGISSHFSCSSDHNEKEFTIQQMNSFKQVVSDIETQTNSHIPLKHMANTGAILCYNDSFLNMVRAGGIIYGIDPGNLREVSNEFNPVLSLKSQIAYLKIVAKGTPVSYGRTFITKKKTKIATIPIGYNDGYPYQLSNKGYVLVRGKKAPIIGTVTMDYIMIDVTDIPITNVGDDVILIGKSPESENKITVEELAQLSGVAPYVITCALGKRIARMYMKK